jgi:hypothetical protein
MSESVMEFGFRMLVGMVVCAAGLVVAACGSSAGSSPSAAVSPSLSPTVASSAPATSARASTPPPAVTLKAPASVAGYAAVRAFNTMDNGELGYVEQQGATQAFSEGYGGTPDATTLNALMGRNLPAGTGEAQALIDANYTTPGGYHSSTKQTPQINGETFLCYSTSLNSGAICAWSDGSTFGVLWSVQRDITATSGAADDLRTKAIAGS